MWYGSSAWMPWLSNSNMEKLERAQRGAMKEATGQTRTTPNEYVYLEAEISPVRIEAKRRAMIAYEKAMRCKEGDPRLELCGKHIQRRLKANKGWREQARQECDKMGQHERRSEDWKRREPWKGVKEAGVILRSTMAEAVSKETTVEEKRRIAEETLGSLDQYEMVLFSDGSVEEGIWNGGAACVGMRNGEVRIGRKAAGKWCSSYTAEVTALRMAVEFIREGKPTTALIGTDSQALVRALENDKATMNNEVEELKRELTSVEETTITIQWIPGHVGIEGNEWADREANEARKEDQESVGIWMDAARSRIKREVRYEPELDERARKVWARKISRTSEGRKEQVMLAQLRAGHCARTKYYKKRIGQLEDATCEKCGEEEEKDHWMECPAWETTRRRMGLLDLGDIWDEEKVLRYLRVIHPEWWDDEE